MSDSDSNTPFSLAFFRGHYDVAKAILEIVKAQYSPTDKEEERYKLDTGYNDEMDEDDEDSYDSDDDGDDSDEPKIVSEIVNKKFTIDNIGQVSMQVKSHTRPLDFLLWQASAFMDNEEGVAGTVTGLFRHTMKNDEKAAFDRLMDWAIEYAGQKLQGDKDDQESYFVFPEPDFRYAVEYGKVSFLAEIIKRTGAGMPLDTLVKKSGVEVKEKPKTYQGLTVYGKKRYVRQRFPNDRFLTHSTERTGLLLVATLSSSRQGSRRRPCCTPRTQGTSSLSSGSSATPLTVITWTLESRTPVPTTPG